MCRKNLPFDVGCRISEILSWKSDRTEEELGDYRIPSSPQRQGRACRVHSTNVISSFVFQANCGGLPTVTPGT